MTSDYVWTPPGASENDLGSFLTLRTGIPDYLRHPVIDWLKGGCHSSDPGPLEQLLRFQAVSKTNLGFQSGMFFTWKSLIELMDVWPEQTLTNYVHFVLSQRNVYRSTPPNLDSVATELESVLAVGGSSWAVGWVQGRFGLVERVPAGVADAVQSVISAAGRASSLLQQSWEMAFGANRNPSHAYFDAVKSVEVLSCPLFSPNDQEPTLGKDINVVRNKPEAFSFAMTGSKHGTPTEKLLAMMQLLWHSQTDRHGSSDYQDVSEAEAQAAVLLASTLVGWLSQGLVQRAA